MMYLGHVKSITFNTITLTATQNVAREDFAAVAIVIAICKSAQSQ